MEEQFSNLIEKWKHQPGSNGGQLAIRGFDFQLILTLNSLLAHAKSTSFSHTEAESLSDFILLTDSKLTITQAKYTLDSGGVSKALRELWCIHILIQTSFTELHNKVNYCIVGKQQSLKDLPGAIERFTPKTDYNLEELTNFKALLNTEIHPNPRIVLAHRLINEFGIKDPFQCIHKWLGQLYSAITKGTSGAICAEIVSILHGLHTHKDRGKPLLLWSINDRAPVQVILEPDPHKAVLLGEPPIKKHLMDGRFTARRLYQTIYQDFNKWLAEAQIQARDRIPVYWLAGGSGCGKSVALLHLLANIKQQDAAATIIWCERQPNRLEQARPWFSDLLQENDSLFIAFDDPFIFNQQAAMETQLEWLSIQLEQAREENAQLQVPFLICCGPDEQLQWFEEHCDNYVDVHSFRLAPESDDDHQELRDWYQMRTGKNLPIDEGDSQQQLLVQTLFQWHTGSTLKSFAQRFKSRLKDQRWETKTKKPFELVSEILAVNRLYANYPNRNYEYYCNQDPQLGHAMDILCMEDQHFSITPEQGGIRFTHPHLANALYQEWYPDNKNQRERRLHIEQWINQTYLQHSAVSDKLEPLWVLAKLSNPYKSDIASERIKLIREELQKLLPNIYTKYSAEPELVHLPVWTNLNHNLLLHLQPSPIDLIATRVEITNLQEPGFRLACHKLIEYNKLLSEKQQRIVPDMINMGSIWSGWHAVMEDYILRLGPHGVEQTLSEYIEKRHSSSEVGSLVKKACSRINDRSPHFQQIALQWLSLAPLPTESWCSIFSLFAKQFHALLPDKLLPKVSYIVKSQPQSAHWSFLWESLWKQTPSDELILLALEWLKSSRADAIGWSYVWEVLSEADLSAELRQSLQTQGFTWLDTVSAEDGSWPFVWQKLSETELSAELRQSLQTQGFTWLDTVSAEHDSWPFVWEVLWQAGLSAELNQSLQTQGFTWLDTVSAEHGSWPFVWQKLSETELSAELRQSLQTQGFTWLDTVSTEHGSWKFVWEALSEADLSAELRQSLQTQGFTWLDTVSAEH
ncbi:MAG: hypothetical protein V7784_17820, partial [Oceanospirillaceae bacterium]